MEDGKSCGCVSEILYMGLTPFYTMVSFPSVDDVCASVNTGGTGNMPLFSRTHLFCFEGIIVIYYRKTLVLKRNS